MQSSAMSSQSSQSSISMAIDDEDQLENDPEVEQTKVTIERLGKQLNVLLEDLLKKYSFNDNDTWKEKMMEKV